MPPFPASIANSLILAFLAAQPALALEEATGHVELLPRFTVANGSWQWHAEWLDDDLNTRTEPVDTLSFPGLNTLQSQGARKIRPLDSKWDFLGMAAGEAVWIFSDTGYCSVGFASTQAELTGNLTITLDSVEGPLGGVFSMYSGSTPNIFMQTIDGISPADVFTKPSAHTHVNWAFSRKGLWIVKLKAQGVVASSSSPTPVSPAAPLVFAIGDHARWKTARFSLAELSQPEVSGDAADPDGDGLNNLMEYALGGDPRTASVLRHDDLQPVAPRLLPPAASGTPWRFCYFRNAAADSEITYEVESSSSLAPQSWTTETGTEEPLSSGEDWVEVSVPLEMPQEGQGTRLFRLNVTPIP